jgi:hypothetical protein
MAKFAWTEMKEIWASPAEWKLNTIAIARTSPERPQGDNRTK